MMLNAQDQQRLETIRTRFNTLQEFIADLPEQKQLLLRDALSAFGESLEELEVTEEELRQQNEDIYQAHHQVETERKHYHDLFEFAPDGYLVTTARTEDQFVEIVVRDDGPGIAPEERAGIFEAFQRGENAQRTKGAGLGLGLGLEIRDWRFEIDRGLHR